MTAQFSCIEIEGNSWENISTIRLSGKLTKEDYEQFVPEIERMMKAHNKVRGTGGFPWLDNRRCLG